MYPAFIKCLIIGTGNCHLLTFDFYPVLFMVLKFYVRNIILFPASKIVKILIFITFF